MYCTTWSTDMPQGQEGHTWQCRISYIVLGYMWYINFFIPMTPIALKCYLTLNCPWINNVWVRTTRCISLPRLSNACRSLQWWCRSVSHLHVTRAPRAPHGIYGYLFSDWLQRFCSMCVVLFYRVRCVNLKQSGCWLFTLRFLCLVFHTLGVSAELLWLSWLAVKANGEVKL